MFEKDMDHAVSFTRLLDLPPELRLHIYEYYLAELHIKKEWRRAPPALAQASMLLRKEVLPIWGTKYSHMLYIRPRKGVHLFSAKGDDYEILPLDKDLFNNMSTERMASIRNITYVVQDTGKFDLEGDRSTWWNANYRWKCEVEEGSLRYRITSFHDSPDAGSRDLLRRWVPEGLQIVLDSIAQRPGKGGLRKEDVDALLNVWKNAVERLVPKHNSNEASSSSHNQQLV